MPKVCVLIPAFNAMRYLPETISTVLQQTYQDFEILIVNDGSTDQIVQWVEQQQDSRIRLINQKNQGPAAARNKGLSQLKTPYVALLDADDLWLPTKLEKQVQILDTQPSIGRVYTWMVLANSQGEPTGHVIKSDPKNDAWRQLIEFNLVGSGSTPLIRKSCFDTVGMFSSDLLASEDWDMWLRIACKFDFAVIKEPLVLYRQFEGTLSRDYFLVLETSRTIIERAFAEAPTNVLHLRNHSYSATYAYLGWRALEDHQIKQANLFANQALLYRPQLLLSQRFLRLKTAILMMSLLGSNCYETIMTRYKTVRGQVFRAQKLFYQLEEQKASVSE